MEKQDPQILLTKFNSLYKELDDVYHLLARHYGLSDSAFWVLYIIKETEGDYTQSKICEKLSLSKQTVNSALKNLEGAGYIRLGPVEGNQKNKQILLTEAGNCFARRTTDEVLLMEKRVFEQFSAEEQTVFLRLLDAYVKRVGREAQTILNRPVKEEPDESYNR